MSMSLNKATIIGNITRDPESRTTPSGQTVCNFGIATNRKWKDRESGEMKEQAEFHNIVAWGKLAETCAQYLKKGSRVYVDGRLQTRSWDDQTGAKKYRTEIVAENMIMLDRPGSAPAAAPKQQDEQPAPPQEDEINVEDIPF